MLSIVNKKTQKVNFKDSIDFISINFRKNNFKSYKTQKIQI